MIVLEGKNVSVATIKNAEAILLKKIGNETAGSVLISLYILKSETNKNISQKAALLWKNFVTNPSKLILSFIDILFNV